MTAAGIPQEGVARVLGISIDTLQRHYEVELATATHKAVEQVAGSLFSKAISATHPQSVTAAIFFLKTRGRWREADVDEAVKKIMVRNAELEAIVAKLEEKETSGTPWPSSPSPNASKPN